MADGLAVFTPSVGLPSETFVQRHATLLAPGRTLTVSTRPAPNGATWSVDGELLTLPGAAPAPALVRRARRIAARLVGRHPGDWRWRPSSADLTVLGEALDRGSVGVAMTEFLDTWLPLVPWLQRRGVRVFAHSHGRDVSVRLRDPWWRERYLAYRECAGVVAVSEVVRARLVELGLDGSQVHVVPCGVDVPPTPVLRPARNEVHVVAIGRLVPKKHPIATVRAFAAAARADTRLRLTMVGDGPLAGEVAAEVASSGVGSRVTILGPRPHDEVLALLRDADVFVQHSVVSPEDGDEEGLPVAVLEAMASGAPVVATRHAGIPEAVADGVTGLLVEEGDIEAMGAAIGDLAADEERRRTFGVAGHARAAERFSWTRERDDLRRLLDLDREVAR